MRIVALPAAAALVALSFAVAPVAHADVLTVSDSTVTATAQDLGPVFCAETTPDPVSHINPFAADGVPVSTASSVSGTFTDPSNPSDVTAVAASGGSTVTVGQAHGVVSTVDVDASFHSQVDAALGPQQRCGGSVFAESDVRVGFDLTSGKDVVVDGDVTNGSFVDIIAVLSTSANIPIEKLDSEASEHIHKTERIYLPPGSYVMLLRTAGGLAAPTVAGQPTSSSGTAHVHVDVVDPEVAGAVGTAFDQADGPGSKYLALPAARGCAQGDLVAVWKGRAGRGKRSTVRKATFLVNGKAVKTVRRPAKGDQTRVTGLAVDEGYVVEVRLRLVDRHGPDPVVVRAYRPCT